jgi:hypothetical protein
VKISRTEFLALTAAGLFPTEHDLSGFAAACYEANCAADLMDFATAIPDAEALTDWGIDEQAWRDAQRDALETAMADLVEAIKP